VDAVYNSGMAAFQAGHVDRARLAFEEALAIAREHREVPHIAAAQFMLGQLAVLSGDHMRAREHAREGFDLYTKLEDDRSSARCLVVIAGAAAAAGEHEDAARLIGAAAALRRDEEPDAFETSVLDLCAPNLEEALGTQRLGELEADGGALGRGSLHPEVVSAGTEE
jgi:tetratricopeptide (TPR) repeat protein